MHAVHLILEIAISLSSASAFTLAGNVGSKLVKRLERRGSNLCLKEADREFIAPELLMIGVQKGATSTLWKLLIQHPKILLPGYVEDELYQPKELHVFDNPNRFSNGRRWWMEMLPVCSQTLRSVVIDGTPDTIAAPQAASRIVNFYGSSTSKIQFVVILRDPLRRMQSAFYHGQKDGWWGDHAQDWTFEEYVRFLLHEEVDPFGEDYKSSVCNSNSGACMGPFSKSRYAEQLERFSSKFASQQFTFALFSHVVDQGATLASTIFQNLGLETSEVNSSREIPDIDHDSPHPQLEDDLPPYLVPAAKVLMAKSPGGPSAVAQVLAKMDQATLFAFNGERGSEVDIAKWLVSGW